MHTNMDIMVLSLFFNCTRGFVSFVKKKYKFKSDLIHVWCVCCFFFYIHVIEFQIDRKSDY